jgi:FkbM family methyltransferase
MIIRFIKAALNKLGLLDTVRHKQSYRDLAAKFNKKLRELTRAEINFYSVFINPGDLCFDIGANIGGKTNIFYKIGANILAVEPDPEAFFTLSKRFGKNNKVVLINKGIGAASGELLLNRSTSSTLSTFDAHDAETTLIDKRFSETRFYEKQSVKVCTLDSIISEYGKPDYCKIATVGYELEVIKGLSESLKAISFTCNVPQHIEKTIECVNLIDKLGVYKYNYFLSTLLNGFVEQTWISGVAMKSKLAEMKHIAGHSKYIEVFAVQA